MRFEYALKAVGEDLPRSVLDVGCGSGRYTVAFAKMGVEKVIGIDMAVGMLWEC